MSLPNWLEECIQDRNEHQGQPDESGNLLNFTPRLNAVQTSDCGQSALDLVYRAAELVSNIQDESRQRESRAQSLCRTAVEKLRHAEKRVEVAERALSLAESRLSAAQASLSAAESRAKTAETKARELDQALSIVEDAIRTKLLGKTQNSGAPRAGVAAA